VFAEDYEVLLWLSHCDAVVLPDALMMFVHTVVHFEVFLCIDTQFLRDAMSLSYWIYRIPLCLF
jgi:hypothetical protein